MTTQQQLTQEKYQDVLQRLFNKFRKDESFKMQEFISDNKVSTNLWTVLVNIGIIEKTDIGYEWQGGYPDVIMTAQVIQGIRNYK